MNRRNQKLRIVSKKENQILAIIISTNGKNNQTHGSGDNKMHNKIEHDNNSNENKTIKNKIVNIVAIILMVFIISPFISFSEMLIFNQIKTYLVGDAGSKVAECVSPNSADSNTPNVCYDNNATDSL